VISNNDMVVVVISPAMMTHVEVDGGSVDLTYEFTVENDSRSMTEWG